MSMSSSPCAWPAGSSVPANAGAADPRPGAQGLGAISVEAEEMEAGRVDETRLVVIPGRPARLSRGRLSTTDQRSDP